MKPEDFPLTVLISGVVMLEVLGELDVGNSVGWLLGEIIGEFVGLLLGELVVGNSVGWMLGEMVGEFVGLVVGFLVGWMRKTPKTVNSCFRKQTIKKHELKSRTYRLSLCSSVSQEQGQCHTNVSNVHLCFVFSKYNSMS